MPKIEIILDSQGFEQVIIDNENGTFTTMSKAHYDELQAAKEAQSL